MKRTLMATLLVCAAIAAPSAARAGLYYGFTIGVTNAPPVPVVRDVREPHVVLATDAMVYVVDDDHYGCDGDTFRYGQYWFVYNRGYWYRGRSFRGPFAVIDVRRVPRAILGVPKQRWKHHPHGGPPGQAKKQLALARVERVSARDHDDRDDDRGRDRDEGRSRGKGHGNGHKHGR